MIQKSLTTTNNQVEFSEHPTVVQRGNERTINIYAAIPDAA